MCIDRPHGDCRLTNGLCMRSDDVSLRTRRAIRWNKTAPLRVAQTYTCRHMVDPAGTVSLPRASFPCGLRQVGSPRRAGFQALCAGDFHPEKHC